MDADQTPASAGDAAVSRAVELLAAVASPLPPAPRLTEEAAGRFGRSRPGYWRILLAAWDAGPGNPHWLGGRVEPDGTVRIVNGRYGPSFDVETVAAMDLLVSRLAVLAAEMRATHAGAARAGEGDIQGKPDVADGPSPTEES